VLGIFFPQAPKQCKLSEPSPGPETVITNLLIVIACVAAATFFLYAVTRTSTAHSRKESNDFTGAVVAVIGTTYAVLLAFMLSGVWNMFHQAQINAEQEANDLVNVYRLSLLLPAPGGPQMQNLLRAYAQHTIQSEFPAMQGQTLPAQGSTLVSQMWAAAGQVRPTAVNEQIALSQLMSTLASLTEHRRIRIMQSQEMLPGILWLVLIAGGIITVAAACFFGVPNFRFHLLQVVVLSFLISLVLVAIADIDRPYQGNVRVNAAGFEFALETFGGPQK
jgi:hypothetical protein